MAIALSKDKWITIYYGDVTEEDFEDGKSLHIELARGNFKSGREVINYVNNGWGEDCEYWTLGGRCNKIKYIDIIRNNKVSRATIKLRVSKQKFGVKPAPSIGDFTFKDESEGFINVYSSKEKKDSQFLGATVKKQGVFSSFNITTEDKESFYKEWYNKYYNEILTDFGSNNNKSVNYDDIKNGNHIENFNFDGNTGSGFIYKDKAYDVNERKGYSESLIQTYRNWLVKKEKILSEELIIKEGVKYYKLREDFLATKEQLDKFLYLQGTFNSKIMYSYSEEADASDPDGKYLAQTLQESKEKQLINNNKTLYKQYNAYDVFGNKVVSSDIEKDAVFQLQNHIQLTSKYVHKMEIDTWNRNVKRS